jgi:chromosome partitioning protein
VALGLPSSITDAILCHVVELPSPGFITVAGSGNFQSSTIPSRVGHANIFEQYRERIENERDVPMSPFSIPEHSLLRYTWDEKMDLFELI